MRILLFFFLLSLSFSNSYAQDDPSYIMFNVISLKALPGHSAELWDGLKNHNDQFHNEDPRKVSVWSVASGPNVGDFLWVSGPFTFSDMDEPDENAAHMPDWNKNVTSHADMGSLIYWRLNNDLSHSPENFTPTMQIARFFKVKDGRMDEALHTFSSLMGVYKEMDDMAVHVFTNGYPGEGEADMVILWQHANWSSLDVNRKLWEKYEEKYDMNDHDFFDNWRLFTDFMGAELHQFVPELSTTDN